MSIYESNDTNYSIARKYIDAGLNIIPLKCDGSKTPKIKFRKYINDYCPWYLSSQHFTSRGNRSGIAIMCGATSGNLEVLDFDVEAMILFYKWKALLQDHPELLASFPIVQTPKPGFHVYYRCDEIGHSEKLAMRENENPTEREKSETLIETRAHGCYVVAPGSPLTTHPTGRPYQLIQGSLSTIPTITKEQREMLLTFARSFNRVEKKEKTSTPNERKANVERAINKKTVEHEFPELYSDRPGDSFNARANWDEILEPHGWEISHVVDETTFWRRPGKLAPGCSASTGYGEADCFHVFSTNAHPFEAGETYSRFAVYTLLNHDGDYAIAAEILAEEGYGSAQHINYSTIEEVLNDWK